jgi:hypothetical protein
VAVRVLYVAVAAAVRGTNDDSNTFTSAAGLVSEPERRAGTTILGRAQLDNRECSRDGWPWLVSEPKRRARPAILGRTPMVRRLFTS